MGLDNGMKEKIKKWLGFPYPPEYEEAFQQDLVLHLYKPLLIVVMLVFFLLLGILMALIFWPDLISPPEFIPGLLVIHGSFLVYTAATIGISVLGRRLLYRRPKLHILLCNLYAIAICLWGSCFPNYAYYYTPLFIAYIYICLIAALVCLFKPGLAIAVFGGNFIAYLVFAYLFVPPELIKVDHVVYAGFSAALSIVIAVMMYQYRVNTFYQRLVILEQNEKILQINAQLRDLVHIDSLTGLSNRRYFAEVLPRKLSEYRERSLLVCAMMVDIDYFKKYNDLYGHQAGDICLRRIVEIMRRNLPQAADLVRYGGEEFFVLLPLRAPEQGWVAAEQVRKAVELAYIEHLESRRGVVTVSIGITVGPARQKGGLHELARQADTALYAAKRNGRNRVVQHSAGGF